MKQATRFLKIPKGISGENLREIRRELIDPVEPGDILAIDRTHYVDSAGRSHSINRVERWLEDLTSFEAHEVVGNPVEVGKTITIYGMRSGAGYYDYHKVLVQRVVENPSDLGGIVALVTILSTKKVVEVYFYNRHIVWPAAPEDV